eukprot:6206036-Pleurochrysis_carterae.AAC.1
MLCRAMGCPTPALLEAAQRVLAYLYHHQEVGLRYELCSQPVHGHSDSDWATRHSTTGWVFFHGRAAISWSSKNKRPSLCRLVRPKSSRHRRQPRRPSTCGLSSMT